MSSKDAASYSWVPSDPNNFSVDEPEAIAMQ